MTKSTERAAEARSLLGSQSFASITEEIRQEATQVFLSPHSTVEQRESAHDRVRAVQIILDAIQSRLDAETIEQKKERHRGNDRPSS